MNCLPFEIAHVGVPPIKCQGIKTKLVPFIFSSIQWNAGNARWIEPFLGSGVVALNLMPERALLADTNRHIIGLYQAIQHGELTRATVREFLECEGKKLETGGADYYYEVRQRFNEQGSPFDFLFLNRSCFNGVMRFNRHGKFNVPFGHKPERFAKAYITKIVNQVGWTAKQMQGKAWEFRVARWDEVLTEANPEDFVCRCGWKTGTARMNISRSAGAIWRRECAAISIMSAPAKICATRWTRPCSSNPALQPPTRASNRHEKRPR